MSDWSPCVCVVCGGGVAKGREEHLHLLINLTHTSWSIRRQTKRGSMKRGNKITWAPSMSRGNKTTWATGDRLTGKGYLKEIWDPFRARSSLRSVFL